MQTPETPVNTAATGLGDALAAFWHLAPVQQAIFVLAVWVVISLIPQVHALARRSQGRDDWQVVWFRLALLFMALCVAVRYFFDLNAWITAVGWLILAIASTMNTVYILRRSRESEIQRLARDVEEARRLLAAIGRPDDV